MINYPYIPPSRADKKAITPTGMLTAKSTKPGSVLLQNNYKFLLKNKNNFISWTCPCPCQMEGVGWREMRNTPCPDRRQDWPDWPPGGEDWSTWWLELNWSISPPSVSPILACTYSPLWKVNKLEWSQSCRVWIFRQYFSQVGSVSFTQLGCSIAVLQYIQCPQGTSDQLDEN